MKKNCKKSLHEYHVVPEGKEIITGDSIFKKAVRKCRFCGHAEGETDKVFGYAFPRVDLTPLNNERLSKKVWAKMNEVETEIIDGNTYAKAEVMVNETDLYDWHKGIIFKEESGTYVSNLNPQNIAFNDCTYYDIDISVDGKVVGSSNEFHSKNAMPETFIHELVKSLNSENPIETILIGWRSEYIWEDINEMVMSNNYREPNVSISEPKLINQQLIIRHEVQN